MNFSVSNATNTSDITLEWIKVEGHEEVIVARSPSVGLIAIIAIHSTSLGSSALGGTRIKAYPTFEHALTDVLLLSKAMTYKSAVAEVGFGGGKSVIIADPKKGKPKELLHAFADAVNLLKGKYIAAEDVGSTLEDMSIIREKTPYVVGLPFKNSSGNPSPFTAWGVFKGICATLKKRFGSDSIEGKKIAIQGLGSVGSCLADYLFWAGADLILSDLDMQKASELGQKYKAKVVHPDKIYDVPCDLFSPCALGGILNRETIERLKCKAVAGAANNQLQRDLDANLMKNLGILYAPDFIINAGGLLNVAHELELDGYNAKKVRDKTTKIYDTLLAIYEIAEKNHESTQDAALALAEYRIKYGVGKRDQSPYFRDMF